MLVRNPENRAPLPEVMNHPWMRRGFGGPPDVYMPYREPLRVDGIDHQVIQGMQGFEFGSEEEIKQKLVDVLSSERYIHAVQHWEGKRSSVSKLNGHGRRSSTTNNWVDFSTDNEAPTLSKNQGCFPGFNFHRLKLFFAPDSTAIGTPPDTASDTTLVDATSEPPDPTSGFHPLISMYYLAREKLERERAMVSDSS
jgi:serine/threonine protein kinase KIN1/2